jgi:outer membrane protein TolC
LRLVALLALLCFAADAQAQLALPKAKVSRLEVIQLGVARNLDLLGKRLEARRLEALEQAAWQTYSPSVFVGSDLATYAPAAGPLQRDRLVDATAGVAWKAPTGTTLSASVLMNQSLSGGPAQDGLVSLALTQPLLKNGWQSGAALPLSEAALQASIQRETFKNDLNAFIVDLETSYWDLALADADRGIKTRSRDRARQQYDDTAENIRRGILAPVEIYVVEDNVVFFEQELLRAEQNLRLARRHLAEVLRLAPDAPLEAEEQLVRPAFSVPERGAAIDQGLRSNPRVLEQRFRQELSQTRLAYANNQALPALDLSGSVAVAGQSDLAIAPLTPNARVGLLLTVPLGRSAVRAAVENARLDAEKQRLELESRALKVSFEIDNGLSDLDSNLKLLSFAQKQVELAELKLAAETDKYKNGISTLADVVRFQRDLDNALIAFQRNIRAIHVAKAKLLASEGTLFQTVGVELR